MKIACIALNSNLIQSEVQTSIIKYLNNKLYEIGEQFSLISYFDNSLESLKNIVHNDYDFMFFIGMNDAIYNHNIKDNISRIIGDNLNNNDACYKALKTYCDHHNIPFSMSEECEVMLPAKSIPLCSYAYYNNGFMYKFNNKYLVYLPSNLDFVKFNYDSYILPLLNDLINAKTDVQVIKCYGILEKDIRSTISEYLGLPDIKINISTDSLDSKILVRFDASVDQSKSQEVISNIISRLNKFIYSLEDRSIFEMANDLLQIQHKTISIGETITCGNIAQNLGFSNKQIKSSIIYFDYENMLNNLNIDPKVISQFGKYSVNIVYELANALLENTSTDNVLFVLADDKESEFAYIAVGDIDGIHVYKNKIQHDESLSKNLSKTAIFYLIKKLRQNSLQFI